MPSISVAFQSDKPLHTYGSLAALVESYGFDAVSVYNDMLYQPAWPALFEMARHTTKIRLGPAAVNPFLSHPISIAGNLALLDEASEGRAYLGLARGAWLDFANLQPDRPVTALKEAFSVIRHLLRGNTSPLEGEVFSLKGGDTFRWPIQRPELPFLLGSWGRRTIQACLPFIQEIKLGGTANPGLVRFLRSQLGPDGPKIVVGSVTVVDEDADQARDLARQKLALYLPVVAPLDPTLSIAPDLLQGIQEAAQRYDYEAAAGFISDELLDTFAFAGAPTTVANQAAALLEAGADRVEFGTPHGLTSENGIRLLGEAVLGQLTA